MPIDLVLAELDMPRMSGAELARAIRGEVQWNDIPVMLITGKSEPSGAVRAYEAGADDVILKPFHFEVLIARIERRIDAGARDQAAARGQCHARRARGRAGDPDRRIEGRAEGSASAASVMLNSVSIHWRSAPTLPKMDR